MYASFQAFIQQWFTNELEFYGAISGLICVWLAARENWLTWPIAMISSVLYALFFYGVKLYSDSGLQLIFIATQCYGLYFWLFKRNRDSGRSISRMRAKDWTIYVSATLLATIIWKPLLVQLKPDAAWPWFDSFTTCVSIAAIVLQSRKKIENWVWWIFVDLIYLPMYWYNGYYATAVLYSLFIIVAVYGWRHWQVASLNATSDSLCASNTN